MSTHASTLALVAAAAALASALMTGNASAFGRGHATAAPVHVTAPTPARLPQWGRHYGYGYGYGRGWCYWHPYRCSYRAF